MALNIDNYENDGFLYINQLATETFKHGEIRDINGQLVCHGLIMPLINPMTEASRDPEDGDVTSFEQYAKDITHYCPIQNGKKIRIYWDQTHNIFMLSIGSTIYSIHNEHVDVSSVTFDLLDKTKCYYGVTHNDKGIILTNIVDKDVLCPDLMTSYNIAEDLAFEHHMEYDECKNPIASLAGLNAYSYGILFILKDGRQLECRTPTYNNYCMLAKPDNMSMYIYYIHCLNKHATGATFAEYFIDLHVEVREFLDLYPEYSAICHKMRANIIEYIEEQRVTMDADAIACVKKLLELEPQTILHLLI